MSAAGKRRWQVRTHLRDEWAFAPTAEQAERFIWRRYAARGCDESLRGGWTVAEIPADSFTAYCKTCDAKAACRWMFGTYWREKSNNGTGCAYPVDTDGVPPERLAAWEREVAERDAKAMLAEI